MFWISDKETFVTADEFGHDLEHVEVNTGHDLEHVEVNTLGDIFCIF